MKKTLTLFFLILQAAYVIAQVPLPFQKKVKPMPKAYEKPSETTSLNENGRKTASPWIVFF